MRHLAWTALLVSAALAGPAADAGAADDPSGVVWVLAEIEGRSAPSAPPVTLEFEAGRVHGSAGCNAFTGPAARDGSNLRMGPFATTRMMCPPAVMDQETRVLAALAAAAGLTLAEGRLVLTAADGRLLLRFVKRGA